MTHSDPARHRLSGDPDRGVHRGDLAIHDAAIPASTIAISLSTMPRSRRPRSRSRCPRSADPGVHDHAILASTIPRGTEPDEQPPIGLHHPREGRYGSAFGVTVHRALELLLLAGRDAAQHALGTAIAETGLDHHHREALADIERTLATLQAERLVPQHGRTIALEYPIAGTAPDGSLLVGLIDFLSSDGTAVDVIDFKTDQPPAAGTTAAATHGGYVGQARCYATCSGPRR